MLSFSLSIVHKLFDFYVIVVSRPVILILTGKLFFTTQLTQGYTLFFYRYLGMMCSIFF